jgi:prepilin-type N-terminal cleavage/methylation domain-containing protein
VAELLLSTPAVSELPVSAWSERGFSLVDMLVTMAVIGVIAGIAAPSVLDVTSRMKLGQGQREVERELQAARLKAVTSNRPMRVRFNCPAAGQYRMVELVGTPTTPDTVDSASDRCSGTKYPFPPTDNNPVSRPNLDGPVRQLPAGVSFGGTTNLEFWPDGSVHYQAASENPWSVLPTTGKSVTVTKGSETRTITVNGLGKITLVE